MNDAFKYIYNKFFPNGNGWHPFIANYYLTYDCDFRCFYCSDGYGKPYHTHSNEGTLEPEKSIEIMRRLSKIVNYAMITGGEPLQYIGFEHFINEVAKLKFKNLALTTNAFYLKNYIEIITTAVDTLVISLDTMDANKADRYWGIGEGTFKKVLENIELAAKVCKNKRAKLLFSSVITPDNIEDQYDVFKFAKEINAEYAGNPQLIGVKPHEGLINNSDYIEFCNFIINEKKKGAKVFGSYKYLRELRDLNKFKCFPFAMLGIAPNGDIYYPCYEIGAKTLNILEIDDLKLARLDGAKKYGGKFQCDPKCHSVCALLFSLMLD